MNLRKVAEPEGAGKNLKGPERINNSGPPFYALKVARIVGSEICRKPVSLEGPS